MKLLTALLFLGVIISLDLGLWIIALCFLGSLVIMARIHVIQ